MSRDYCGDMRAVIDAATGDQDGYIAAVVALEIVEKLRVTDLELLQGWLDEQAVQFVREAIGARDRSIRSRGHRTARAREFNAAARKHRDGDDSALHEYLSFRFTLADDVRKPLGKLNHEDLLYVRDDYQHRANDNLFYVSVMDALAERVTEGVVEDHFTEAQLQNIFGMFR
jgi:hypothetical protein